MKFLAASGPRISSQARGCESSSWHKASPGCREAESSSFLASQVDTFPSDQLERDTRALHLHRVQAPHRSRTRSRMSKAIGVAILMAMLLEFSAGARTLKQPELVIPEIALTSKAFTPAEADAPAALLIVEPVAAAITPAGAAAPAEAPSPIVGVVVEIPFGEAAAPAGEAAAPGPAEIVGLIVDTVVPEVPEDFFASAPASPSSE